MKKKLIMTIGLPRSGKSTWARTQACPIVNQDSIKLESQKMTCMLPKGIVMIPESDIGNCHGMLKEGLQDLVIRKLHTYLVQNLGKLNLEMLGLPEVN